MITGAHLALGQRGAVAMTAQLTQAIGLLALGNAALGAHLATLVNPHLDLRPRSDAAGVWLDLLRVVPPPPASTGAPPVPQWSAGADGTDRDLPAAAPGLVAHVMAQLGLLVRDARLHGVALVMIEALEPSGWLADDLPVLAARAGVALPVAAAVLAQLQQAEPAGLFARSLAECLALQLRDRGWMTPAFAALVDNLPLVAEGDLDALALACGCPRDDVVAMIRRLRGLNPKPGAAFGDAPAPLRPPDLLLRPEGAGWLVELNPATLPALRLRGDVPGGSPEALRAARWLLRAVDRRNATALRIASEIVARQRGLLTRGPSGMDALTIADITAATGLHRSTVSRVTAALTVALPGRTLPLRAFFCARAAGRAAPADGPAVPALLDRLRALVAAEDPGDPLSDAALARRLSAEGAALARRTVAKYRAQAGIAARDARRAAPARNPRQGA